MDFDTLLQTLGIPALVSTAVSGFFAFYFKDRSEKKLRSYQALIDAELVKYKNQYDRQLIDYKSGYEKELAELNNKFKVFNDKISLLNVKRAEVINQLYQRLVKLQTLMNGLALGGYPKTQLEEIIKNIQEAHLDYSNYFSINKLYFTTNLCLHIDKISKDYLRAFIDYAIYHPNNPDMDSEDRKEARIQVNNARKSIQDEVPITIMLIEAEFRGILGVE